MQPKEYIKQKQKPVPVLLSALFLTAVSCASAFLLPGCAEEKEVPAETTAIQAQYAEAPAWAGVISIGERKDAVQEKTREAPAISTMYMDSKAEGYGPVQSITVYAADNPGLPYDLHACRHGKDACFYLFLPSAMDLKEIRVRALHTDGTESGVYTLSFGKHEIGVMVSEDTYFPVVPKQSKIPSLLLEFEGGDAAMRRVNQDEGHKSYAYGDLALMVPEPLAEERGWKTLYVSRENDPRQEGTLRMRGRGNWTWHQRKKPYQLTTEKNIDLLGMGKAKNWILLANVMDASLLRNQILYDLGTDMGLAYSPDIEPVDLFINGVYVGQYSLTEKIEVGESRVNIDPEQDFLLELDHYFQHEQYTFTTAHNKNFTVHSPETSEGVKEARRTVNRIEEKMYDGSDYSYADHVDVDSFIRYFWLQDFSRNNDAFIGSNFFYYIREEDKLYAGPIWDMDNSCAIWGGGENLEREGFHCEDRGWFKYLLRHDDYKQAAEAYYNDEFSELLHALPDKVDAWADYIRESAEMNYLIHQRELYVHTGTTCWEEDVEYLKEFFMDRTAWYDWELD